MEFPHAQNAGRTTNNRWELYYYWSFSIRGGYKKAGLNFVYGEFEYRFKVGSPGTVAGISITRKYLFPLSSSSASSFEGTQTEHRGNKVITYKIKYALCESCGTILNDDAHLHMPGFPVRVYLNENFLTMTEINCKSGL